MNRPKLLLPAAGLLAGCASLSSPAAGLVDGHLPPCPDAPHCVSSEAGDERHAIAPFLLSDAPGAWEQVAAAVKASERTTVVEQTGQYLRAEVVSPWHVYTDDLELRYTPAARRVDVRSSSRVGYYDFGVNRKRIEALRERLGRQGLLRAP